MANAVTGPRVSVALCTHNGSAFVEAQLVSILNQTNPAAEIVLSDDASTDDTVAIARRAVESHNRAATTPVGFRVIENPVALGVVRNFEQAIGATSGDLVALSDQDDLWHPNKLQTMLDALGSDPGIALAFSDARIVDAQGAPLGPSLFATLSMTGRERRLIREGKAFEALLGRNLVTGATVVFRRELLAAAAPFPDDWVHDEWLAVMAAANSGLHMVDEPLIDYRQHGGNVIGASRLTVSGRLDRLREPRSERNRRLLARAEALRDRLVERRADNDLVDGATHKVAHERVRSGLPRARLARLPGVARELVNGRYARYGRGVQDVVRDLVQPAD